MRGSSKKKKKKMNKKNFALGLHRYEVSGVKNYMTPMVNIFKALMKN